MLQKIKVSVCAIVIVISQSGCAQKGTLEKSNYWNDGLAEVSVYALSQNRYNDVHQGQLVNVQVREDFLTDKQVKNETYTSSKSTPVLKNIRLKKFPTGIYDYSVMTSVFTPVDANNYPHTLKVSSSSQEWCGNTYMQMNLKKNDYILQQFSYFEKEGDRTIKLDNSLAEDAIVNLIRLHPDRVPVGDFSLIPSLGYLQLKHAEVRPYASSGKVSEYVGEEFSGNNIKCYSVEISELNRVLKYYYEADYPYRVVGWTDTYPSAFDKKLRATTAKLSAQKKMAYWSLNSLNDQALRQELGLLSF